MPGDGAPDFEPGEIGGREFRQMVLDLLAWIRRKLTVKATHPLDREADGGLFLRDTRPIMARIRGGAGTGSNPYGWDEVIDNPPTYSALSGGRSSDHDGSLYEVNGKTGLGGRVYLIRHSSVGDWRFLDDRLATTPPPPPPCGQICFHIKGCGGLNLDGALVGLTGPAPFSPTSCTTGPSPSGQCCIPISPGGTYHYSISKTGFIGTLGTVTVPCTATLTTNVTVTLTADTTNYFCPVGGCSPDPIAQSATFHATDGVTTTTLTFNPSGYLGAGWYGPVTLPATNLEAQNISGVGAWHLCLTANQSLGGICSYNAGIGGTNVDCMWFFDGCGAAFLIPTCFGGASCFYLCVNTFSPACAITTVFASFPVAPATHTGTKTLAANVNLAFAFPANCDTNAFLGFELYPSGTVTFSFAP